jgi:hypothetical protein
MATEEKEREIIFLEFVGQIKHSISNLGGCCLLIEKRVTKQFKSATSLLQDLCHIPTIIDCVLQWRST